MTEEEIKNLTRDRSTWYQRVIWSAGIILMITGITGVTPFTMGVTMGVAAIVSISSFIIKETDEQKLKARIRKAESNEAV